MQHCALSHHRSCAPVNANVRCERSMRTLLTGLLTLVPLCTFASPEVIYRYPQSFGELSRENLAMTLLPVHLTASSSNLGSRNEAHMRYAVVIEKAAKNFA